MAIKFLPATPPLDCTLLGPLLPLLSTASFVCFISKSDTLFDSVRDCAGKETPSTVVDRGEIHPDCSHLLFLDATSDEVIDALKGVASLSWEKHVIIANLNTPLDLRKIESNYEVFRSSSVAVRFHNTTLVLSSPLFPPRVLTHYFALDSATGIDDMLGKKVSTIWVYKTSIDGAKKVGREYHGATGKAYKELGEYLNFVDVISTSAEFPWFKSEEGKTPFKTLMLESMEKSDVCVGLRTADPPVIEWFRNVGPALSDQKIFPLVRRPTWSVYGVENVLSAFAPVTWLLLASSFLIVAAAYWTLELLEGRRRTTSDVAFTLIGHLFLTGNPPARGASSLVLVWWSLFAVFLGNAFTSDILERTSLPVYAPRVDTLAELESGGYRGIDPFIPTNSTVEEQMAMARSDGKISLEGMSSGSLVLEVFLSEKYDFDVSGYRAMREPYLNIAHDLFIVKRESPLYPLLTAGTQRLLEAGVWQRHLAAEIMKHVRPRDRRLTVEEDRPDYEYAPLSGDQFKILLYILGAAACLSLVLLVLEITLEKRHGICEKMRRFGRGFGHCYCLAAVAVTERVLRG